MKITILTLFPEMFDGFLHTSIIHRALEKKQVEIEVVNFRDFTLDKHNKVDEYPYGGGQGMVLMCQPIVDAILAYRTENSMVILITPEGKTFQQKIAHELALKEHLIFICGHYEGFDARISRYVDMEISLGDFILTGGEVAVMAISDAVIRLLDGVIKESSHQDESFENQLLEYPQYTRPVDFNGDSVPEVLLSGHHENIRKWRLKQSLKRTLERRPDLLQNKVLSKEEMQLLESIKNEESFDTN
ncbi:MAG: tRNA (guanosine(37)-N1)-methyltransferase TrmD [Erysipelotrichaceae bacterium]|nr:tRNA (guanosine(37)-N1)-methyltransferase TrmD [Erysipelotrichaceae bacterium]